jgi:hypothetical protein
MDKATKNARIDKAIKAIQASKDFNLMSCRRCIVGTIYRRVLNRKFPKIVDSEIFYIKMPVAQYLGITYPEVQKMFFSWGVAPNVRDKGFAISQLEALKS